MIRLEIGKSINPDWENTKLENVSYEEIVNIIKSVVSNKDGTLFVSFEEDE